MGVARRAATRYTHCRTGRGNLRDWLYEIGTKGREECRWRGRGGTGVGATCEKMWRPVPETR